MFRRRSDIESEMTDHVNGAESKMGLKLTDSFEEKRSKSILRKPLLFMINIYDSFDSVA